MLMVIIIWSFNYLAIIIISIIFTIKDAKLYVPGVTSSARKNQKLSKNKKW